MTVFVIAEAGVNHNGSIELAKQLIDAATETKANSVKFQTFKASHLVSKIAEKAEYQKKLTDPTETQLEMIKKLELNEKDHYMLIEYCNEKNIEFLSSPFDVGSLKFLVKLGVKKIKIPSGEITNAPLLLEAAKTRLPLIISTGMATLTEIESALGVVAFGLLEIQENPSFEAFRNAFTNPEGQILLKKKVTLLHCTTEYPAPLTEVNLQAMRTIHQAFGLQIGYSDHTEGTSIPIAAVALGAKIIEKHFTLDKNMHGPDHKASLDPIELGEMIKSIREVEQALGSTEKRPTTSELKNIAIARKSLVAKKYIQKNEIFSKENLTMKRPGKGISPMRYWEWLGKKADRSYEEDELIWE